MKKMNKNIVFAMVVMALVFCLSMGVAAATDVDADVTIDVQAAGDFVLPYQTVTVNSGLAESYGYTDTVSAADNVSALDVMVKMHELVYGDDFTTTNCTDYLNVSADGWILKALTETSWDWSFILNGECAHSDVVSAYGGYEALTVNQTVVDDGDVGELVKYQDNTGYSDQCVWFMQDNARVAAIDVKSDESFDLHLAGYPFMSNGAYGTDAILANHLSSLSGAQLALMDEDGTLVDISGAITDENGDVTLSIDDCGAYAVVAYMPAASGAKTFLSVLAVNVHQAVKVSVYADAQTAGDFVLPYQMIRVSSDFAESYGYKDNVSFWKNASALDVLVKIHKMVYGDDFTAATCRNYLDVSADGWILKSLAVTSWDWSLIVNGECAHSDVASAYGGYEAYNVNQTVVSACDTVELVKYQDTVSYGDNCLWLMQDGNRVDMVSAPVGEEITLHLTGYPFMTYGAYGTAAIKNDHLSKLAGAKLAVMNRQGELTDINGAVTDGNGDVTFSFNKKGSYTVVAYLPGESATKGFMTVVSVNVYKEKAASHMSDLVHGKWYYNSVSAMLSQGVMEGVSDSNFAPNGTVTRGMFVTILYRCAGSPNCSAEAPFSDVDNDAYYAAAVDWAYEQNITSGITATKFAPNDYVTREQMATMIVRFAEVVGYDLPYGDGTGLFDDDSSISSYANQSVYRLVKAGVIKGMGHNQFAPKQTATRAQAAEMIYQLQNLK